MEARINDLVQTILAQAKLFLEDADEFYPFGTVLTKENELKPCGVFLEEDCPSSSHVFSLLESAILKGIAANQYLSAAIGLDVLLNDGDPGSALEIRLYHLNNPIVERIVFAYTKTGSTYSFSQILNS